MKKRLNFIIFVLFFIFIGTNISAEITGDTTITGEAIDNDFSVSILVTLPVPALTILSPENETYLFNVSLLLNYTVSNEDYVWYNIDGGSNTTITSATYFNTSQGSHTLYLFANNSWGTTAKNVSFTTNSTRFIILYSEYNGTTRGNSTEFINYTYEDLQSLSDIILENTGWGKIEFNEAINATDDSVPNDNLLDLDTNTHISNNRVELNSTALPNFNKSATIYLYNLTFTDPRILMDGSVCPTTICTEINYSGETLTFNVTGFTGVTVYSAEETSGAAPPSGGGGAKIKKFTLSTDEIKVKLKQGQTITRSIIITNDGNQKLSISIENPKLRDFLRISEESFDLGAGKSKSVVLDIFVGEDTVPDLYIGKLIVRGDRIEKEILVVIEVESKKVLFDTKVEIPQRFMYVMPNEKMLAKIDIFNLGDVGKIDVLIEYILMDEEGNKIISEQEMKAIETSISFVKEFKIPKNAKFGRYVLYVKATYKEQVGSASAWFNVGKKGFQITIKNLLLGILIIILIFIIYKNRKDFLDFHRNDFYYWPYYKSRILGDNSFNMFE